MCARVKSSGIFVSRDSLIPEIRLIRGDGPAMRAIATLKDIKWGGFCRDDRLDWWRTKYQAAQDALMPISGYVEQNTISIDLEPYTWAKGLYLPHDYHHSGPTFRIITREPITKFERIVHPRHPLTIQWKEVA